MSKVTELAGGQINASDRLTVELVEPDHDLAAAAIRIRWPQKPTITTPTSYDSAASDAMRILANAVIELAAIKVWKKL
jgi:hypothetical protein